MRLAKERASLTADLLKCSTDTYVLERKRANLTVTVEQAAPPEGGPVLEGAGAATPVEQPRAAATLVTGPSEHWFLSADLAVQAFQRAQTEQ